MAATGLAATTVVLVLGVQSLAAVVSGDSADVVRTAPAGAGVPRPAQGDPAGADGAAEAGGSAPGAGDPASTDSAAGSPDAGSADEATTDAGGAAGTDAAGEDAAASDAEGGDGPPSDGTEPGAGGEGEDATAADSTPEGAAASGDAGEEPAPLPAATEAPTCTAESVQVLAAADSAAAAPGTDPALSAVVRAREGAQPCAVVLGPDTVQVEVSSGDELVYDSGHCPKDTSGPTHGRPVLVAPGVDARVTVTWPRVHSAPGCPAGMPTADAGTYQVTASVDGVVSESLGVTLQD